MASSSSPDSSHTLDEPFNAAHFESLPHVACVTLFHRTGPVGCGTRSRDVATGRLLDWTAVVDVDGSNGDDAGDANGEDVRALSDGDASGRVPPYVAVMDEEYYTAENVARLAYFASRREAGQEYGTVEEGGPLRGVLVLASSNESSENDNGNNGVKHPSPEPLAPQGDETPSSSLTVGSSHEWNANNAGDGLANSDMYGLPTAYVADAATADYLRGVASDQGAPVSASDMNAAVYPSIVAEFNYYMGPDGVDSAKCLGWTDADGERSPRCAPLGGDSVWGAAGSPVPSAYGGADGDGNNDNGQRPVVLLATSIDSTSMFHDLSPGANNAASNTLALLLAAQLVGSSIKDEVLDGLYSRIVFGFFQGESYGYIGSRRFLRDVVGGFECSGGDEGVASVYKRKDEDDTRRGCLHPLRADLTFQNLGQVRGMVAVDQVANLAGSKDFYVQGGDATDSGGGFAGFLAEAMAELSASDEGGYAAQASSAEGDDDGVTPLPPTPLSSLVRISSSAAGGVVLTGYDDAFVADSLYHSHLDSASSGYQTIDKDAIAAAATLIARTAVAAAYQDADNEVDAETASAYALQLLPDPATSSSSIFTTLYHCLFEDGNCETFLKYGTVERTNDAVRTGSDLGMGVPLGTPPSFYTSIYDASNGQSFVRASGKYYGALNAGGAGADGEPVKEYGADADDAFLVRPSLLEMSISGLLNDYLGRGSFAEGDGDDNLALATCKSSDDCAKASYCDVGSSGLATPACAGGSCVCGSRSHYHPALDEALSASGNVKTGMFEVRDDDEGVSALYTEPYWSNYVGVRVYNDAGNTPGVYTSGFGAAFAVACVGFVWRLKKTMVKEKVY